MLWRLMKYCFLFSPIVQGYEFVEKIIQKTLLLIKCVIGGVLEEVSGWENPKQLRSEKS